MHIKRSIHIHGAVAAFLGLAALGGATPARAQLGLGLVPMRVELQLKPGQEYSGSLKLSSGSMEATRVRSETDDFFIDDQTTPQFERDLPHEAQYSCKTWLTVNPVEIEIDKEGFVMIRYTLRLPADVAEGSYNCAAGFTTLPSAEQATQGIGMRMAVRVVAAIYVQVGSPAVQGGLKEITLEPLPPQKDSNAPKWQAVLVLENKGTIYYRPTGKLDVLDAEGKVVESVEIPSLAVLRQRDQRFVFPLKTQPDSGHYKLRARVDIGTHEILQGTVDVEADTPAPSPATHTAAAPQPAAQ